MHAIQPRAILARRCRIHFVTINLSHPSNRLKITEKVGPSIQYHQHSTRLETEQQIQKRLVDIEYPSDNATHVHEVELAIEMRQAESNVVNLDTQVGREEGRVERCGCEVDASDKRMWKAFGHLECPAARTTSNVEYTFLFAFHRREE